MSVLKDLVKVQSSWPWEMEELDKLLTNLGFEKNSGSVENKNLSEFEAQAISVGCGVTAAMVAFYLFNNPQVVQSAIDGVAKIGSSIVPDVGV